MTIEVSDSAAPVPKNDNLLTLLDNLSTISAQEGMADPTLLSAWERAPDLTTAIFANLQCSHWLSVQPVPAPAGLVFYLHRGFETSEDADLPTIRLDVLDKGSLAAKRRLLGNNPKEFALYLDSRLLSSVRNSATLVTLEKALTEEDLLKASNNIHIHTQMGPGEIVISSPEVASRIEGMSTHVALSPKKTTPGIYFKGSYRIGEKGSQRTFQLWVDPYANPKQALVLCKGAHRYNTGVIWAPYLLCYPDKDGWAIRDQIHTLDQASDYAQLLEW